MKKHDTYLTHWTSIFAFATIVLGVVLALTFPMRAELADGFHTPIIAFEFAKTSHDLEFLSGSSQTANQHRIDMNKAHVIDMFFPFVYGGFIALLLIKYIRGQPVIVMSGMTFALLIVPFDIHENLILLGITDALNHNLDTKTLLEKLNIATWFKWGSIGMSVFFLSVLLTLNNAYRGAVISALTAFTVLICWLAQAPGLLAEIMSFFTLIFFLFFSGRSFSESWKSIQHSKSHLNSFN